MISGKIVEEMEGDLFAAPLSMALGHCVSADAAMGGSVAEQFRQRFQGFRNIEKDQSKIGSCIVLKEQGRFIYKLVTKDKFYHHTTLTNLRKCFQETKIHMVQNHVMQLALSRQEHDSLLWADVCLILEDVFRYTWIKIIVFTLIWEFSPYWHDLPLFSDDYLLHWWWRGGRHKSPSRSNCWGGLASDRPPGLASLACSTAWTHDK